MNARKLLYATGAAFVIAYFFFFTWKGLLFQFDNDDMFNIYMGWSKPLESLLAGLVEFWRPSFRPAGLLAVRQVFEAFGFNSLPLRILCFVFTIGNIVLCFWFARLVSRSERIAALTALLFAFHSRLMEVWFRSAIIYDILCFTFFYLGLSLYIDAREKGASLSSGRATAVLLCFLLAVDSKEMAVAFPLILLAWELLFHGVSRTPPRMTQSSWVILFTGLVSLLFILSKTHGGPASTADPSFTPSYTLQRFEQNWNGMLTHLFLRTRELEGPVCLAILGGLFTVAAALRSRPLLFAWIILFFTAMPVVFIPPRGGYVLYIPYAGWTLYAATVLVRTQDLILRRWPRLQLQLAISVFLLVAWRWGKANLHDQRIDREKAWLYDSPKAIRQLVRQVAEHHGNMPVGTSMLFLEDGFHTDEWTPVFVLRLFYKDQTLRVDRIKMMDQQPRDWTAYSYVFSFEQGGYLQRKPERFQDSPR